MPRSKIAAKPTRSSARIRRQQEKNNAQPLADLPPELLLQVFDYLSLDDRRSLSTINSQFRQSLAPHLFRTLRANNLVLLQDTHALERIVAKYGTHVHKLFFVLFLDAGEDRCCSIHETPSIVWDLLDGRALPTADTLCINFSLQPDDFAGKGWDDVDVGGSLFVFGDEESMDRVRQKERKFHWRALFNECLEAISLRSTPLKRLDLLQFPLKRCTALANRQWETLLNGLKELSIDLWGVDDEDVGCSNTLGPYLSEIKELRDHFFRHLISARRVTLEAHWTSPVGGKGLHHTPIPFAPTDLPQVEHLSLQFCFVDEALFAWLKVRRGQLRSLHLSHCFSASTSDGMADNPVPWAAFFACVRETQPMLDDLTFCTFHGCPTHDPASSGFYKHDPFAPLRLDELSREENQKIRGQIIARPDRLPFKYKYLHDEFGLMCTDEDLSLKRFWEGEDQKEFTALVKMVEENKDQI